MNRAKAIHVATDFIAEAEGFRAMPYRCPAGVLTIGYGFTDPELIALGNITQLKAYVILMKLVKELFNTVVQNCAIMLTSYQAAALISFTYNFGESSFITSTLLEKINNNELAEVPDEFRRWIYSKHKPLDGLRKRREAEIVLWLTKEE